LAERPTSHPFVDYQKPKGSAWQSLFDSSFIEINGLNASPLLPARSEDKMSGFGRFSLGTSSSPDRSWGWDFGGFQLNHAGNELLSSILVELNYGM
jgi:hypothetical protein